MKDGECQMARVWSAFGQIYLHSLACLDILPKTIDYQHYICDHHTIKMWETVMQVNKDEQLSYYS
jgi:hypothetical protein